MKNQEDFMIQPSDVDTLTLLCTGAIFFAIISTASYILWSILPHLKPIKGSGAPASAKHSSRESSSDNQTNIDISSRSTQSAD